MSMIQQIREKAAWLVFGLIALSLIGFLLMDAFVARGRMFSGNSQVVGTVNGNKLDIVDFDRQVSTQEEQYRQRGYPVNDMTTQNIKETVWKQFQEESALSGVYKKLGIEVGDKELNDMLVGMDAIPEIRQSFTDPKTGIFDAQAAAATINQLRTIWKGNRRNDKEYDQAKQFFEQGVPQVIKNRMREKYVSLIASSAYVPKWMVEKLNADNSQTASISYVNTPYSTIPDSVVKVSDDDIKTYIDKRKDQYKQEESRSIAYVAFSAAPTSPDSASVRQQILNLKNDFAATNEVQNFIARNGSDIPFEDSYQAKSKVQGARKDSVLALPKGAVYGPYLDGSDYVIAKMLDEKQMPDSVRARHILVATVDAKTGQPIMEDSLGKKKIDSIKDLIDHGTRFDSLAAKLSDDGGSKAKGGDLGYFPNGRMVKEFNEFCFSGKTGDKKIVKSQFGYHYIEIMDQKAFEPAFRIAYIAKKIDASSETDANASGMASQFAGLSRNAKAFDENVQKDKLQKLLAPDIKPADNSIQGLGVSRELVRWVNQADPGDVSGPTLVADKYVVALLTEINPEGTMSVAKARPLVEPMIRNEKKAEKILQKIAHASSLEAVASASGQAVQKADSIGFSSPFIPNLGQEPKVVGMSFDKELAGKPMSPPIPGNGGVFFIKVLNVIARANFNGDTEQLRRTQEQMQVSLGQRQVVEVLIKSADTKDNRGKF
jgi:peptidyl-prolyl cis-trans isomerase D